MIKYLLKLFSIYMKMINIYYQENKGKFSLFELYRNLSAKEKEKKCQCGRERYKKICRMQEIKTIRVSNNFYYIYPRLVHRVEKKFLQKYKYILLKEGLFGRNIRIFFRVCFVCVCFFQACRWKCPRLLYFTLLLIGCILILTEKSSEYLLKAIFSWPNKITLLSNASSIKYFAPYHIQHWYQCQFQN